MIRLVRARSPIAERHLTPPRHQHRDGAAMTRPPLGTICTALEARYETIGGRIGGRIEFVDNASARRYMGWTAASWRPCVRPAAGYDWTPVIGVIGPRGGIRAAACARHRDDLIRMAPRLVSRPRFGRLIDAEGHELDADAEAALLVLAGGIA